MENLPTRNNNPGDLKNPSTGNFQTFPDAQSGFGALKADLQGKITGNTKTGLNGNSTLQDFASTWAPDSDGNNSTQYAQKLASKLGVTTDTPIGKLSDRLDDFASAIADNEGYKGNRVSGMTQNAPLAQEIPGGSKQLTHGQLIENINAMEKQGAKPEEVQSYLDSLKNGSKDAQPQSTTQPNQPGPDGFIRTANIPQAPDGSAVNTNQDPGILGNLGKGNIGGAASDAVKGVAQSLANPFLKGLSSIGVIGNSVISAGDRLLGNTGAANARDAQADKINNEGVDYGYLGNAKPVGAGFDIKKGFGDNAKPLADAVTSGASAAGTIAGGESLLGGIKGLLAGGSGLFKNEIVGNAIKDGIEGSQAEFEGLSATQKYDAIKSAISSDRVSPYQQELLSQLLPKLKTAADLEAGVGPSVLKKITSSGLLKKTLKIGLETAGIGTGADYLYSKFTKK